MKKIHILYDSDKLGMTDFNSCDYNLLHSRVKSECNGKYPNFGNKIWMQGIISELSVPEVQLSFGYQTVTPDYINSNCDCVILPLANCFHKNWIPWLIRRKEFIEQLKIPVFVISCGVQADSYDGLDRVIEDVKEPAVNFIKSVYATGGEFALRGYFTGEFFNKLGFRSAEVVGCPSLFSFGRNLSIPNNKVSENDFKTTINGSFDLPITDKDISTSYFMCQGNYGKYLYDPDYFIENPFTIKKILKLLNRENEKPFLYALADNQIKMIPDLQQWMSFFIENNISFSFGSRIHGTIIALLAGVPSMLFSVDSRTREMGEYYGIPMYKESMNGNKQSLYQIYSSIDFSDFNNSFPDKFDRFQKFFSDHGIIDAINQNNIFMQKTECSDKPIIINQKYIDVLNKELSGHKVLLKILEYLLNQKKKLL